MTISGLAMVRFAFGELRSEGQTTDTRDCRDHSGLLRPRGREEGPQRPSSCNGGPRASGEAWAAPPLTNRAIPNTACCIRSLPNIWRPAFSFAPQASRGARQAERDRPVPGFVERRRLRSRQWSVSRVLKVRDPGSRLSSGSLRSVWRRPARPVCVPRAGLLSVLHGAADGRHRRAPGRSRHSRSPRAPMGPVGPVRAALPAGLR